jgi:hypothetical protein
LSFALETAQKLLALVEEVARDMFVGLKSIRNYATPPWETEHWKCRDF